MVAGYLISSSYSDWQDQPISTSIETHPIGDLDFPTVTVCPPKGSHTALNYDLMKADNQSLTEQDREMLKDKLHDIFMEAPHLDYINTMLATVNPQNVEQVYKGFFAYPLPYKETGFEMKMWNNHGTFQTPSFQERYEKDIYSKDINYHAVLKFPDNLAKLVGDGSLVINLEVETRKDEGLMEEVVYQEGSKFTLIREKKTWENAEAHCQSKGGHLASILNDEEQLEVMAIASAVTYAWIGATDQEEEGVWKWTDGSSWEYTQFKKGFGTKGVNNNCARWSKIGGSWNDEPCTKIEESFVCKSYPKLLKNSISLNYTNTKIPLPYFEIGYAYQVWSQMLMNNMHNKPMTGFRPSWRIEPLFLQMTTSELGKTIKTPGFRENIFNQTSYESDRAYRGICLFPEGLQDQVSDGTVVIQLNVDTREGEGWQEEVDAFKIASWGNAKYKLFKQDTRSWASTESYCRNAGGRLPIVLTEEDQQELTEVAGDETFWLGATDQEDEGVWKWVDESPWNYTNWKDNGLSSYGADSMDCLRYEKGKWSDWTCTNKISVVCQSYHYRIKGNSSLSLNFTKEQLVFPSFQVSYKYKFTDSGFLDPGQDKRMTGFQLNCFLQDANGSQLTETKPEKDTPGTWQLEDGDPSFDQDVLVRLVELASIARVQNVTRQQILSRAIQEKAAMIKSGFLQYRNMCKDGQLLQVYYQAVFGQYNLSLKEDSPRTIKEEDVRTGFMLFSALVYCPTPLFQIYGFLQSLLTSETPRTIIQATVNTIEAGTIEGRENQHRLFNFYIALDQVFHFQMGQILLATSSSSRLKDMMAKDLPYFTPYLKEIDQCLNGISCQGLLDIVQNIGITYRFALKFKHMFQVKIN